MPQPARQVIETKDVVHLLLRLRVLATRSSVGSISLIWLCALFFVQRDASLSRSVSTVKAFIPEIDIDPAWRRDPAK